MSNSISLFKDSFNGGTRGNRFLVYPEWPTGVNSSPDARFKIVSTSIPVAQINSISVPTEAD